MAERWYVLPGWRGEGSRQNIVGVKYIDLEVWTGLPQITGVGRRQWRLNHDDNRVVLIRAEGTTSALDLLALQSDVIELPPLGEVIGNPEYNLLRNYLRSVGLPTDWLVRNVTTFGEAVDEFIEMCTLARRFEIIHARSLSTTYTDPDDSVAGQDVADLTAVTQSLGWDDPPPGMATIGAVHEWGRNQGRIPPGQRRN